MVRQPRTSFQVTEVLTDFVDSVTDIGDADDGPAATGNDDVYEIVDVSD